MCHRRASPVNCPEEKRFALSLLEIIRASRPEVLIDWATLEKIILPVKRREIDFVTPYSESELSLVRGMHIRQ
jgi:hypothetical protein